MLIDQSGDGKDLKEVGERKELSRGKKKAKKALLLLIFALLLLAATGALVFKAGFAERLAGELLANMASRNAAINEPEFMYAVPEILVNLPDNNRGRFLSVKFYLGHDEPKLEQELEKRMPEIRDVVNKILWSKTADDINSVEGKENLRKELLTSINALLRNGKLRGVYFWHVLVQ